MPGQNGGTTSTTIQEDQSTETNNALHLRGSTSRRPRVRWEEGTVDNENMGKKKSKSKCQSYLIFLN